MKTSVEHTSGRTVLLTRPRRQKAPAFAGGGIGLLVCLCLVIILLSHYSVFAAELTCKRLPMLMESFHDKHYAIKSTNEAIRARAVDQMIKQLDPSKTLFYESDLEKIKPLLTDVFENAEKNNCASLKPVYDLLIARSKENEEIIKKILGPDFKPDKGATLYINAEKRPFSKTAAEKQTLLKKMVQFQIENAAVSGIDMAEARKQMVHRYQLQTMRIAEQNPAQLVTTAAEAFARALDPHTSYLSPKNMEDLRIHMQLSLEGIGAILSSDNGFTIIEELIPGGGAEKSGFLKPKDKIIAVAQEGAKPVDVIDMDLRDVVSMIRGKKGTRVTLTILRNGANKERFDVTILRDKIDVKDQEAKITYETRKSNGKQYRIGVIDLPSFYGGEKNGKSCYKDMKKLLAEARLQNVDGIVLNLSRNSGGLLDEAVRIAGLFIGPGGIVALKDSRGKVVVIGNGWAATGQDAAGRREVVKLPAEDPRAVYTGPLVVLTSRMSASASEIVAGALKEYHRAVIVGADHTYGKGSVQSLISLPSDLGAMKVTTGVYFLPGGQSTQRTGVIADVRLPGWYSLEDYSEATQDYALPSQAIAPFLGMAPNGAPRWKPVNESLMAALASKSQDRVAKDAKFAKIIKENKESADKKGFIQLDDYRKTLKKENGGKGSPTRTDQKQKVQEQYAPYISESVSVLLDILTTKDI